ncbi:MAG TPA: hypothetical protein VEH06_01805 [Candidatus Bathyarchaeia archaeon]|nr:hypothetical protein [Candidatus Bathyarchaeia archaeon]
MVRTDYRYFEPFLGGGHLVSDKKMTFTVYLSDANLELIKAYEVAKDYLLVTDSIEV